jgi:two-component system, LytTR family, response regulator
MNPIRLLIVDDEPLARAGVKRLLEHDDVIEVIGECADGAEAVVAILDQQPDAVLLDIKMPEMSGLDVVRTIGVERMPLTVFITAYDEHALRAFELHAVDYLLKPFDDDRFHQTIHRLKSEFRTRAAAQLSEKLLNVLQDTQPKAPRYLSRIVVRHDGRTLLIKTSDIEWIEAADYYARIHATGGKQFLLRETMNDLDTKLDPEQFFRAHRSAIVNLEKVKEIQPYTRGEHVVIMTGGAKVRLSRGRREKLEERFGQSI